MSSKDELYRLSDMRTKEVSVVDRAANKKKFLIIKRSDPMKELTEKANGELTVSGKTESVVVLSMAKAWKSAIADGAVVALEKLTALIETVKGATEVEDVDELEFPTEIVKELAEIAEAIQVIPAGIEKAASTHQALLKEKTEAIMACATKIASGKLEGTELTDAIDKLSSVSWSMRQPAEIVELSKAAGGEGHWMSQMKGLFGELKKIVEEFKGVSTQADKADQGSGVQLDSDLVSSFAELTQNIEGIGELVKSVKAIEGNVNELQGLKGDIAKAHTEISKLKTGVDLPASHGAEVVNKSDGDQETSWPRDLNQ